MRANPPELHPLFPPEAHGVGDKLLGPVIIVPNRKCRVVDFFLGPIPIELSPHYIYARDLLQGQGGGSSASYYQLYRNAMFSFNPEQSLTDLEFFRGKVLSPRFDIPIEITSDAQGFLVVHGFHRLAIAAAHGRKFVRARRIRAQSSPETGR